jgi:hypothetical protein
MCLALRETTNAGRAWSKRPLPAALVSAADRTIGGNPADSADGFTLNVRFADTDDGWIYGGLVVPGKYGGTIEPVLWSTHNGGSTWEELHMPGLATEGSIFDLEAAGGKAYFMAEMTNGPIALESSPVSRDSWRKVVSLDNPAGGAQPSGSIALQGPDGWAVAGNDRGTSGAARLDSAGQWVPWVPPCASVGGSFAAPAASTSTDLVAVCVMGGFASSLSKSAPPGATLGSSWLYFSDNGGASFEAGPELGPQGYIFGGVLASPSPGVVLLSKDYFGNGSVNKQDLMASYDRGRRWSVVYRGDLVYLGFTSPVQGVGIVQSSTGSTKMIMTFDGGHDWAPVTL